MLRYYTPFWTRPKFISFFFQITFEIQLYFIYFSHLDHYYALLRTMFMSLYSTYADASTFLWHLHIVQYDFQFKNLWLPFEMFLLFMFLWLCKCVCTYVRTFIRVCLCARKRFVASIFSMIFFYNRNPCTI